MKKDIPFKAQNVLQLARDRGFYNHSGVSKGNLTVVSLEPGGVVLRFFAPEVQVRPWGSEISGTIGLALSSLSNPDQYESTISQHILNWRSLRKASRLLENPADVAEFFQLLTREMQALPSTPPDILKWARQGDSWLEKQLSWGKEPAVAFIQRAKELQELRELR